MRLLIFWGTCWITACQTFPASPMEFIRYGHLSLSAETIPVWSDTCLQKSGAFSRWAVSLILQRDQVSDVPEWVSGHRMALSAACEIFSPELLIIEVPPGDSLFYPRDSAAREAWQTALRSWLLEELLPALSTYTSLRQVAWGKGFAQLPLPESFWRDLVRSARQTIPHLQWGFVMDTATAPPLSEWDFVGRFVWNKVSSESDGLRHLRKPTFYFLPDKVPPPDYSPDTNVIVLGYVFYSTSHLPVTCQ